jgi:hypothetical protein
MNPIQMNFTEYIKHCSGARNAVQSALSSASRMICDPHESEVEGTARVGGTQAMAE